VGFFVFYLEYLTEAVAQSLGYAALMCLLRKKTLVLLSQAGTVFAGQDNFQSCIQHKPVKIEMPDMFHIDNIAAVRFHKNPFVQHLEQSF
jgi:hypothetical protein